MNRTSGWCKDFTIINVNAHCTSVYFGDCAPGVGRLPMKMYIFV